MSNENDWSDDENDDKSVEEQDMLLNSGGSESEEEFLNYLSQTLAIMNNDESLFNLEIESKDIKIKKKRKRKKKQKQYILLNFSCDEIKNEKKKWRSKRMEAKKKKDGKVKLVKRRFRPRLPKPNKIKNLNNKKEDKSFKFKNKDFPTLGKVVKSKNIGWCRPTKKKDLEI